MSKRERRGDLRARRRSIAAARDLAADGTALAVGALAALEDRVRALGLPAEEVTITAYEPLPGEPDVTDLVRDAYARGVRVLVPITLADLDLDWAQWTPDGIGEPLGKDAIADVTVAFIPGLSVDAEGTRMGQGGGCYDKALPRVQSGAPVICVLHPEEDLTEPPLEREAHDIPVDGVLTAQGTRWVRGA